MTLKLYYHPFSSFCQKVQMALYERVIGFEPVVVNLGDPDERSALEALWPLAKFPVLRDEVQGLTIPESSSIIEYLDLARPGAPPMVPEDPRAAHRARLWDRVFDAHVMVPMQKVVGDHFRPAGTGDPHGVGEARVLLAKAYKLIDAELARTGEEWMAGDAFTLADCAAAPALFYSNIAEPFAGHSSLEAYYARLLARPSFARAVDEARPYRDFFSMAWPAGY